MIVEVAGLTKSYLQGNSEVAVLKGVNLSIAPAETVAILGQSGSGKSTLLALLAALDSPTSGKILIQGKDITVMTERDLAPFRASHIGIVFQQYHLLANLSAVENVGLPLEIAGIKNAKERALMALEKVGLMHRKDHLASRLSGGECQRVAIARALEVKPQILLADEPSGNLDRRTGNLVMNLMFELIEKERMTLILVTHNEELAHRCQKQLTLEDGVLWPKERDRHDRRAHRSSRD